MATIRRFEDVEAWQKSRVLSREVNKITKYPNFRDDADLKRQLKKSAGSIMDNIAEGFERAGKNEFIQFLSISKGSAGEIRSQFYRSLDQKFISDEEFQELYNMAEEIGKMIDGLISYLRGSDYRGTKYKKQNISSNHLVVTKPKL
jgi:four helix bundle protein